MTHLLLIQEWRPCGLTHVTARRGQPIGRSPIGRYGSQHPIITLLGGEDYHGPIRRNTGRFIPLRVTDHHQAARVEILARHLKTIITTMNHIERFTIRRETSSGVVIAGKGHALTLTIGDTVAINLRTTATVRS